MEMVLFLDNSRGMFQKSVIVILLIIAFSCRQDTERLKPDPNSRQVEIDFADVSLSLPKVFQRFSADELIYAIESADSSEISESDRLMRIERLEIMKSTNMQFYIYVDTTNINNTIIFLAEKYLKLDKEVRQYILSNADKTIRPNMMERGVEINRIDSKYFKGKKVEILKLKYELMAPELVGYWSVYMVTTVSNSFQVFITMSDAEDYESKITRMRVGL